MTAPTFTTPASSAARTWWRDFKGRREFVREYPEFLRMLPPGRNTEIVRKRLVEGRTLADLSQEYGLSRAAIRLIEAHQFMRLRRQLGIPLKRSLMRSK